MASHTYTLFAQAIRGRKQITCSYGGHRRVLCPVILGHRAGEEKALTFQVGGTSASGLPTGGEWRCLFVARVTECALQDGPWRAGSHHGQPQGCVGIVDLDANPASPYRPLRRVL